jgi:hypothetical protein
VIGNASEENRQDQIDTSGQHSTEGHEPWCDQSAHALTQANGFSDSGCVGSPICVGNVGGWLTDNGPLSGTHVVVDWRSVDIQSEPLTLTEAADLLGFLGRALAEAGAR